MPRTRETPLDTRSEAAEGALSVVEPLSDRTSSTLYVSPLSSTVGVSELAYCMPSTSFLPPEAESPDRGSNTPILMTLSPLLVLLWPPSPPQATSDRTISMASSRDTNFFMQISS